MVTDTPPHNDAGTDAKTFLAQAQEAIGDAFETTVDAVKQHPVATAAIAAGAAAAIGGAAYAATHLRNHDSVDGAAAAE